MAYQQLTLPEFDMTVNLEVFLGLTPWTSTDVQQPPMIGWWKCRDRNRPGRESRRWWNGQEWSLAVFPEDDEAEVARKKHCKSTFSLGPIEWCGLASRHPDRYPYRLVRNVQVVVEAQCVHHGVCSSDRVMCRLGTSCLGPVRKT